mmetsp:Transcript_1659/g.3691  ORF Transcript_1659/g.3691 Transcript_1659/m.3691 type:complete len:84 (+) Transcript_1659:440-691(+)
MLVVEGSSSKLHSFFSHTLKMRQPLSDEQDASTNGPWVSSRVGRHASFLMAAMWQSCVSKRATIDGGFTELSSKLKIIGTDHN